MDQGKHKLNTLFITTFNGSLWTTAIRLPKMYSPNGVSLADYLGNLVGIYREASNILFMTRCLRMLPGTWVKDFTIQIAESPSRPAVATFKDRLFCVYRGVGDEILCTSVRKSLAGWTPANNFGGDFRTCDGPALAGFANQLICVIRDVKSNICWDSFNGSVSRGFEVLTGWRTSASPTLAVYNNELY